MFKREHTTTTYDVRRVVYPRGRAHIVSAPVEILIRRVMKERTAGGGVAVPLQLPVAGWSILLDAGKICVCSVRWKLLSLFAPFHCPLTPLAYDVSSKARRTHSFGRGLDTRECSH